MGETRALLDAFDAAEDKVSYIDGLSPEDRRMLAQWAHDTLRRQMKMARSFGMGDMTIAIGETLEEMTSETSDGE